LTTIRSRIPAAIFLNRSSVVIFSSGRESGAILRTGLADCIIPSFMEIETRRLRLRMFTPDDLNELAAIRADSDVMRYIGSAKPESIEQVQAALNKNIAHWEQHGFGRWAVVDKQSNKLIGWCGLSYLDEDVEIGYGIAKPYWGQRLASEAAAATIKY